MTFITRTTSIDRNRFSPLGRGAAAVAAVAIAGAFALACSSDSTAPAAPAELDGPSVSVGTGAAHAFILKADTGATTLGIELNDAALAALPDTDAMWTLPLPAGASVAPWDHAELNWNAHGHPPLPIYGIPHFDFHFYTITPAAQATIQGGPDTTPVPSQYVAPDYESQVMAVPMMGVHWVDSLAPEYHGHTFDRTFIYGFSNGSMAFVEPMITLAYLQTHPVNASQTVKQPAAVQLPGRYPSSYSVNYDAVKHVTRITIDSLRTR